MLYRCAAVAALRVIFVITLLFPLGANAHDDVLEKLGQRAAALESMTCDFVQTKHLSLLSDKLVSHGTMEFRSPALIRWEYTRPYSYRFILNGDRVFVGNDSRSNVMDTRRSKLFGTIARVMMNTVTGKVDALGDDFVMEVRGAAPSRVIKLTPKRREMKQMLKSVELTVDELAGTVSAVKLVERNGDITDIVMENVKLNVPVDASRFDIP